VDRTQPDVVWTTVFADGPGGGNPCPLVFGADGWPLVQMQAAAAEFGAETAFVLPPVAGGDVRLRYFVPQHEMEMCVHATVAATVFLGRQDRLPKNPARVETPLGVLDVRWDAATATVQQFAPTFGPELTAGRRARLLAALGVDEGVLGAGPIRSVSTARPKLMIALRDEVSLDALTPDFEALWALCDDLDVTGAYPFTLVAAGADVAARQFPVRAGYLEDPATGVAACALGAHLAALAALAALAGEGAGWRRLRIAQGRAMGRPSMITAEALVDESGAVTATRVGGAMTLSERPTADL
jgi:PhzF family phenazine biosynthesis protein